MAEINISLTQFVSFTTKQSGSAKVTAVRKIKYQDYSPATDYWRELREGIKTFHENDYSLDFLDDLVDRTHESRKSGYAESVKQYKRFLKNKSIEYFDPGKAFWSFSELSVNASPELGLYINGAPYLIKLYFKEQSEKLDKRKASSPLTLMSNSTRSKDFDNPLIAVLNIKKNRLFEAGPSERKPDKVLSLRGEAAHFIHLWNEI